MAWTRGQLWDKVVDQAQKNPKYLEQLKADHIQWGDIIPPFTYSGGTFAGMNWTTEGQAIYANDCKIPVTTLPVTGDATPVVPAQVVVPTQVAPTQVVPTQAAVPSPVVTQPRTAG